MKQLARHGLIALGVIGVIGMSLLPAPAGQAAESDSPAAGAEKERTAPRGPSRDEFKVVVTRNIFNPDRGYRPPPKAERKSEPPPAPPRTEELTLTGVLVADTGSYGFFDGTKSEFRRVAKVDQEVAGFTVRKVTTKGVELVAGTNTFQLALREKLLQRGSDPWAKGEGRSTLKSKGSYSASKSGGSGSSSEGSADSGSAGAGEPSSDDEARRKRLLELLKKRRGGG